MGGRKLFRKKRSKKQVVLKPYYSHKRQYIENPSLDHFIDSRFVTLSEKDRAKSLLLYFKRAPDVKWDENGNLLSPLTDYNIIDIISQLIQTKTSKKGMPQHRVDAYRLLLNVAGLPKEFVQSGQVKTKLYGGGSSLSVANWVSYR